MKTACLRRTQLYSLTAEAWLAWADEVDDEDCEEERDAHDAEHALPFFDDDAVEHGMS